MRLEAYPVKQTAYLSMTSIFIRRGDFAYDPVKGFLESPWPQGEGVEGASTSLQSSWDILYLYLRSTIWIYLTDTEYV